MIKELRIKDLVKIKSESKPEFESLLVYKQERKPQPVFKIPTNILVYNKYNGRILSLVKSYEKQFHTLNPEIEKHKEIIEQFLWESKPDRNRITQDDLKMWGQKKVGIVTKDGIIIDGNRLLARFGFEQEIYSQDFEHIPAAAKQLINIFSCLIISNEFDMLLIKDPEVYLDAAMQAQLAEILAEKREGRKYVIETKSEFLISRFKELAESGKIRMDDIAVYDSPGL